MQSKSKNQSQNLNQSEPLSEQEKYIYNTYLKYLAQKAERPYKRRENFDTISSDIRLYLQKLNLMFERNPEVDIDLYFKSGFKYINGKFIDLKCFLSFSSIFKFYSRYINEYYSNSADSESVISAFVEGLRFIISYLKENNKNIIDYPHITNEKGIPIYLVHLKKNKINLYHLHAFNIRLNDINLPEEILNIYLEGFKMKFFDTQMKFGLSGKIKEISKKLNLK